MSEDKILYQLGVIKSALHGAGKSSCEQDRVLNNILAIISANVQTPGVFVIASGDSGSIAPGMRSVSIHNTGDTEILINGVEIPPGEIVEFSATMDNVLDEITYDAQLSSILITTLQ